jgi:hypothetical protein
VTDQALAKLTEFTARQSTDVLCQSLEILAAKRNASTEESLAHSVIIDVLVQRYPEVDRAFDAWAESDQDDGAVPVIVAAARAAAQA